jgi:uncharacterized delta-60 repeat protein
VTGFAHLKAIASAACVMLATEAVPQWSFSLDTAFRTTIIDQNVNALRVLQDGRIFLSGRIRFPGSINQTGSVRLLPDGARDLTFPGWPQSTGGGKLFPWNDGFYVSNGLIWRMTSVGLIDPTFLNEDDLYYFIQSADYHVFPDGRVLMSGQHLLSDTAHGFTGVYGLVWLTNTGGLDTTRTHRSANGVIWDFAELPDGRFICSCSCTQYEGQPVDRIFRVHADGSLDTSFNSGVNWGNIYAYHPLPDGRVYVGGRYKRAASPNDTLYLARFMPDGSLDATFNNSTHLATDPGITGGTKVTRIVPWMDDKLFVMGVLQQVNGEPRGGLCVLDTTGQLLPLLDECMTGAFSYQGSTNASIHGIVPTPDSSGFYIHGTYAGYTDGTTNDTLQRFVSRLLVEELSTGVQEQEAPAMMLYPNPASTTAMLELDVLPPHAQLVLRDALGREVLRQGVSGHYTSVELHGLPEGCYSVELLTNAQRMAQRRVFVQR